MHKRKPYRLMTATSRQETRDLTALIQLLLPKPLPRTEKDPALLARSDERFAPPADPLAVG